MHRSRDLIYCMGQKFKICTQVRVRAPSLPRNQKSNFEIEPQRSCLPYSSATTTCICRHFYLSFKLERQRNQLPLFISTVSSNLLSLLMTSPNFRTYWSPKPHKQPTNYVWPSMCSSTFDLNLSGFVRSLQTVGRQLYGRQDCCGSVQNSISDFWVELQWWSPNPNLSAGFWPIKEVTWHTHMVFWWSTNAARLHRIAQNLTAAPRTCRIRTNYMSKTWKIRINIAIKVSEFIK